MAREATAAPDSHDDAVVLRALLQWRGRVALHRRTSRIRAAAGPSRCLRSIGR
jgi:hypothetical protein